MDSFIISADSSLKKALEHINENVFGFVCVVDSQARVIGTITDGDVRRAILKGFDLNIICHKVMNPNPVLVTPDLSKKEILDLFKTKRIRNIPVLNEKGSLIDVINLNNFLEVPILEVDKVAVIMAGGEGRRLRPYTDKIPKPMLEVDGKPILEQIILKLKHYGFNKFYLSVNYLAEVIMEYFGDGALLGVKIFYLRENQKLGTAGALSMLPNVHKSPVLILNGDVISGINFQKFMDHHVDNNADFTMAASTYKFEIPFGVLKLKDQVITGVEEKPTKTYLCNAGIYVLSPDVIKLIPKNQRFDMTELLNKSIERGLQTNVFPLHECWLDVGRKEDLLKAQQKEST